MQSHVIGRAAYCASDREADARIVDCDQQVARKRDVGADRDPCS